MQKSNKCTMDEIRDSIDKIESMIIEEIILDEKKRAARTSQKTINESQKTSERRYPKHNGMKFCEYHKTSSHSNEECRQQRKKGTRENDRTKGYSICESIRKPKTIEMEITINKRKLSAIIDTGATYNFIPKDITEELEIEPERLQDRI
ncbi:hypothetical protein EQH57_0180 [Dictyocoela roeselum]|nr:hypothetical protein EQH57_0180 [Dictyocoela roeselum]